MIQASRKACGQRISARLTMDWLLSHPIPVLLLACIVGIVVGWSALERQSARRLAVAGAIVAIGAALAGLAWTIDTPSECAERTVLAFIERAVCNAARDDVLLPSSSSTPAV